MSLDAVQANISLHHLEIKSRDPKMLAEFYSKVMNMNINRLTNQKFLCDGAWSKNNNNNRQKQDTRLCRNGL